MIEDSLTEMDKADKLKMRVDFIKSVVAKYYGEEDDVYDQKTRRQEVVHVKHVAMYTIHKMLKITWETMAEFFDCNHATCIHAVKKIDGWYSVDKAIKSDIKEIQEVVRRRMAMKDGDSVLTNDHYFIDLDDMTSIKINSKKAIILVGFDDDEIELQRALFDTDSVDRKHTNTGMYILENKNDKD